MVTEVDGVVLKIIKQFLVTVPVLIIIRWRNGIYYNPSKIMKLVPFILIIINRTSKQHKRMPQKVSYQNLKGIGEF